MKTLIIGYNHHFNDKRVMRTVKSLRKLGTVYYQYAGNSKKSIDGVISVPLKKPWSKNSLERYKQRRKFDKEILKLVETLDYDFAYFHYFPASRPVKVFKAVKKRGKSLIYDLHEIIPVQFLPEKFSWITPMMWTIFRRQLSLSDALISVSQEAMDFMLMKSRVTKPFLIVKNYANYAFGFKREKKKEIVIAGKSSRNNDLISEILISLKNEGFSFKSIGIKSDLADVNLPFLPYDEMMDELSKSAFSIIAYQNRKLPDYPNEVFSLPNKFFDSLAAGTPVIVNSRFQSMVSLVEKYNVGIVIDTTQSVRSITNKIIKAWNHYETFLDAIKMNAEHFVWNEKKEREFIDFILEVIR